mgnify:FL=1
MKLLILLSLIFISLTSWNGKEQKTIKASGRVITEQRSVTAFSGIAVSQGINLYVTPGENYSITVKTDDNILPYLKTEVEENTLRVHFPENVQIKNAQSLEVQVTLPQVKKLSVTTGAMLKSTQLLKCTNIDLKATTSGVMTLDLEAVTVKTSITTSGDIYLKGKAEKIDVQMSTSGNLNAADFPVKFANIKGTTGAKATIEVSELLEYYMSTGSDLMYRGNPTIKSQKLTSGGQATRK